MLQRERTEQEQVLKQMKRRLEEMEERIKKEEPLIKKLKAQVEDLKEEVAEVVSTHSHLAHISNTPLTTARVHRGVCVCVQQEEAKSQCHVCCAKCGPGGDIVTFQTANLSSNGHDLEIVEQ